MENKFTRNIEDFTCANCGAEVEGNGYTNHCPHCLYSKHVDINPGDRAELCHGLMEPIDIEQQGRDLFIIHLCSRCGFVKRNKVAANDDKEVIYKIINKKTHG